MHFSEEVHRRIYEVTQSLIRTGKIATPITLKTFLGDQDLGGMTVSHYLARLAAEATTVINAEDYGRTIYDLAMRRQLIVIGEDMVNVAYDAPVDEPPQADRRGGAPALRTSLESGRYEGGFQNFSDALRGAIDMAAEPLSARPSSVSPASPDLDRMMGGLQPSDLVILAGRPAMGKTSLATNIAFNIAKCYIGERQPDGTIKRIDGGIVGFFSLEMSSEQLATRIIAEQVGVASSQDPPRRDHEAEFPRRVADAARRWSGCRSTSTRPAASPSRSSSHAPGA